MIVKDYTDLTHLLLQVIDWLIKWTLCSVLVGLLSGPPREQAEWDSDEGVCERCGPVRPRNDVRPPLLQPLGPDYQDQPDAASEEGGYQVSDTTTVLPRGWE